MFTLYKVLINTDCDFGVDYSGEYIAWMGEVTEYTADALIQHVEQMRIYPGNWSRELVESWKQQLILRLEKHTQQGGITPFVHGGNNTFEVQRIDVDRAVNTMYKSLPLRDAICSLLIRESVATSVYGLADKITHIVEMHYAE